MASDKIDIKYLNKTGNTDFEVMVFTKNYSTRTPKTYYVAWEILRGQTSVQFKYPVSTVAVGAFYEENGLKIVSGPFDAQLGSSWRIIQDKKRNTAVLQRITGIVDNPNGTIVIENKPPAAWVGRKFDVGIFKEGKLLVTHKDVHVGDQANFMLQPKLFFAVVRNVQVGDVYTSMEISTNMQEFDLTNFPSGMEVTLTESAGGGEYSFSAKNMIFD